MSSEEDLQQDDGSNSSDSDSSSGSNDSDDEEEDPDFVRKDPRTKEIIKWELIDNHSSTNYTRPITESFVNCVQLGGWSSMTPAEVFFMQLPDNELEIWCAETSKNLLKEKKHEVDVREMKLFLGCLFAVTQGRKVGGITKCFETVGDGLFPASDLGRFGMNLRRFQAIMKCLEFADCNADGVDTSDVYWRTEQLFHRFNEHYAKIITHGTYVNVDERIFWSYSRVQPEGIKVCGRKPKGTGQECKTLSCIDMNVTTTFEHVRGNSTNEYIRELTKEYGKAASVVLRLCKKAHIEGSNRIVIADSWFANLSLYRGLRSYGLHLIGMIKQGDGGFPKNGLCKLLDIDDKPRGSHVTAKTRINNQDVIAIAWKGKSEKSKKNKKKRKFWMSTFIASDCTTTLPGAPAQKKRHTPDGRRATSVYVPRPKLVEDYYNAMPGTDIVNRNAQFLIGLETAIRTENIHKRMLCTVLGTWMANAYGMAMKYFTFNMKKELTTQTFVRQVILEGLFELTSNSTHPMIPPKHLATNNTYSRSGGGDAGSILSSVSSIRNSPSIASLASTRSGQRSRLPAHNQSNTTVVQQVAVGVGGVHSRTEAVMQQTPRQLIDSQAIDPYVHTMQRLADPIAGTNRQQRCVMCYEEGRSTKTSYYCSLCTLTANKETDRKASKHAYCVHQQFNCFSRHIAKCYQHMNQTGMMTQRQSIRAQFRRGSIVEQQDVPIAGKVVSRHVPARRRKNKRRRTKK